MNSGDNPNHEIKADEDLYNIPKVILEKSFHSSLYDSDYNSNIEQRMARNLRIKDIALNFNPNHKPHAKSPLAKQEVQATGDPNANDSKITKPRSVIITFNVKKVKIDDPRVILDILKKTLEKVNISYLHISLYNLNCVYSQANIKSIVFEIEIVKFKSKKSYGLKCKRLHGSAINYKTIIENIYTVFDAMK
ncbi:MAG: MAP microtubule affinity-regulating kinase 1 [Marteilia pararefringens]